MPDQSEARALVGELKRLGLLTESGGRYALRSRGHAVRDFLNAVHAQDEAADSMVADRRHRIEVEP